MLLNWNYEKLKKLQKVIIIITKNFKVTGFSIDSRSLKKGDLFCALKGKNHDGHDFLFQAYKKVRHVFLTKYNKKNMPNLPYIKVDNVLNALEKIAENVRKKIKQGLLQLLEVLEKQEQKEMLNLALGNIGKTFANEGNFNNL